MKYILLFSGWLIMFSNNSFAAGCVPHDGYENMMININIPDLTIQHEVAVGTTIYTGTANWPLPFGDRTMAICDPGGYNYGFTFVNGWTPNASSHIAPTNLNGIGVRTTLVNPSQWVADWMGTSIGTQHASGVVGQIRTFKIELVKTATSFTSGVLEGGTISAYKFQSVNGGFYNAMLLVINSPIITDAACTISKSSMDFPIGDVGIADFSNTIGFTPDKTSTQNLGLTCAPGANINVTMTGTQNPDVSVPGVLKLTNQGSAGIAKGVGVQLLYNDTPLKLNTRILLKTSSGGTEIFPLVARYYQTKTAVSMGVANATATLNLTYQ